MFSSCKGTASSCAHFRTRACTQKHYRKSAHVLHHLRPRKAAWRLVCFVVHGHFLEHFVHVVLVVCWRHGTCVYLRARYDYHSVAICIHVCPQRHISTGQHSPNIRKPTNPKHASANRHRRTTYLRGDCAQCAACAAKADEPPRCAQPQYL